MRRDSAGAATQTWALCIRAAHAWACVLRNCISVCACVRHGPGARVPVRLSMPPASSSADSQEVQCVGGAPHPRAPLPSHGICPTQNHPFEFKFGFRQAPCQGMVPREHHWRRGPGRIQPPNCQSMRRSLRAAPAEVRGSRLSLNFNRVTRVTAAGPPRRHSGCWPVGTPEVALAVAPAVGHDARMDSPGDPAEATCVHSYRWQAPSA